MKRTRAEILEAWQDTLKVADDALRQTGAAHEHRQNLKAIQAFIDKKVKDSIE